MTGTTASTITARSAHREWATRPPDERFASVHALHEAARARRLGTMERRIDTGALGTLAVTDDELALRDAVTGTAPLTHWSFEQLATTAGAPPKYLRSLPASRRHRLQDRGWAVLRPDLAQKAPLDLREVRAQTLLSTNERKPCPRLTSCKAP